MKTYYLLIIASWLAGFLPPRLAYRLCSLIGGLIFYVKPSIRLAVMDNMRHVLPQSSHHERRNIARRVIRNNIKNYYDLLRLPHLSKNDLESMVTVYGVENLEKALTLGRGVILTSGHIGNFNLVAQLAAVRGFHMAVIAEDIKPAKLYNLVNRLRANFGLRFIKAGSSQVRTIYTLLKANGGLLLAADRNILGEGVATQFFDAPTDLPPGPVALAARLNVPLIPVHVARLRNNKSIVTLYPPLELEHTGDNEGDVKVNLRKLARVMEEMILKGPDQWVVLQRVWDPKVASVSGIEQEVVSIPISPTDIQSGSAPSAPNGNKFGADIKVNIKEEQEIPYLFIPLAENEELSPASISI